MVTPGDLAGYSLLTLHDFQHTNTPAVVSTHTTDFGVGAFLAYAPNPSAALSADGIGVLLPGDVVIFAVTVASGNTITINTSIAGEADTSSNFTFIGSHDDGTNYYAFYYRVVDEDGDQTGIESHFNPTPADTNFNGCWAAFRGVTVLTTGAHFGSGIATAPSETVSSVPAYVAAMIIGGAGSAPNMMMDVVHAGPVHILSDTLLISTIGSTGTRAYSATSASWGAATVVFSFATSGPQGLATLGTSAATANGKLYLNRNASITVVDLTSYAISTLASSAISHSRYFYTSHDGVNWTPIGRGNIPDYIFPSRTGTYSIACVRWDPKNNVYVASVFNIQNSWTSPDGITWTEGGNAAGPEYINVNGPQTLVNTFIPFVGVFPPFISSDDVNWVGGTNPYPPGQFAIPTFGHTDWDATNSRWIDIDADTDNVYVTPDTISWTRLGNFNRWGVGSIFVISSTTILMDLLAPEITGAKQGIARSTDGGVTWTMGSGTPTTTGNYPGDYAPTGSPPAVGDYHHVSGMATNGSVIVAVGLFGGFTIGDAGGHIHIMASTDDGITWQGVASPADFAKPGLQVFLGGPANFNFSLNDVTYAQGQFIAVGGCGNTDLGGIYTSTDGFNWTAQRVPAQSGLLPINATPNSITYSPTIGRWVCGGLWAWTDLLPVVPGSIATDRSGNIYIASFRGGTIYRFSGGSLVVFATIPSATSLVDIKFGRDGNLYVIADRTSIWKVTTGGVVTHLSSLDIT